MLLRETLLSTKNEFNTRHLMRALARSKRVRRSNFSGWMKNLIETTRRHSHLWPIVTLVVTQLGHASA
jgi:hypothetical protein